MVAGNRKTYDTVAAGTVCSSVVCGPTILSGGQQLALIQFPVQQYGEGFCPCEALEQGTMVPELVL